MLGHSHEHPAPRFSVVIPAFNEAGYLPACLQSLARQDFTDAVEVIVVDNNSTDRTAEIGRAHGATVLHQTRPGVCWARQAGTLAARGEIVISTDADTVFTPGWLTQIDRKLRADPDCVAVAGPCQFQGAPRWAAIYTWLVFHIVHLVATITGRVIYGSATNIAFRKSEWTGYDTTATQGGDEWGLLRALRSRGRIAFDLSNPTLTSARRLQHGLAYNLLVTCLYYYLLAYLLNRLLRRTVIGTAPAFRHDSTTMAPRGRTWTIAAALAITLVLTIGIGIGVGGLITHLADQ